MSILFPRVAIVGGAGYVGSALVPHLIERGYQVKVIDLFLFGENVFGGLKDKSRLTCVKADIRNVEALKKELAGVDAVIHLACVSNDPSFELDPALGKSINYDAFGGFLEAVKVNRVKRLIYASSSSVYGVREEPNVTEETPCQPLTDYSKFKLLCEQAIREANLGDTQWVVLRPATVCGYAPRLRLDLTVNILTIHALVKKQITVFGGKQLRPNIHVDDMVAAYEAVLEAPAEKINHETFNVGFDNLSVADIAELVRRQIGDPAVTIKTEPTNDLRSYHVNSEKIAKRLGFRAKRGLNDAVQGIVDAYRAGRIKDPLTNPIYYNIKVMQQTNVKERINDVVRVGG